MSKKKMMKKMAIIGLAASVSMSNLSSIAAAGIETIPGNVEVLSVNATDTKASISNDVERSKKSFEVTKAEFQDSTEKNFEIELSNCELANGDSLYALHPITTHGQMIRTSSTSVILPMAACGSEMREWLQNNS